MIADTLINIVPVIAKTSVAHADTQRHPHPEHAALGEPGYGRRRRETIDVTEARNRKLAHELIATANELLRPFVVGHDAVFEQSPQRHKTTGEVRITMSLLVPCNAHGFGLTTPEAAIHCEACQLSCKSKCFLVSSSCIPASEALDAFGLVGNHIAFTALVRTSRFASRSLPPTSQVAPATGYRALRKVSVVRRVNSDSVHAIDQGSNSIIPTVVTVQLPPRHQRSQHHLVAARVREILIGLMAWISKRMPGFVWCEPTPVQSVFGGSATHEEPKQTLLMVS